MKGFKVCMVMPMPNVQSLVAEEQPLEAALDDYIHAARKRSVIYGIPESMHRFPRWRKICAAIGNVLFIAGIAYLMGPFMAGVIVIATLGMSTAINIFSPALKRDQHKAKEKVVTELLSLSKARVRKVERKHRRNIINKAKETRNGPLSVFLCTKPLLVESHSRAENPMPAIILHEAGGALYDRKALERGQKHERIIMNAVRERLHARGH